MIFLERTGRVTAAEGGAYGDRVKAAAGGVPTYGHGGRVGVDGYGPVLADIDDRVPAVLVLGLGGRGLEVSAQALGGTLPYKWGTTAPERDLLRSLQESNERSGQELGRKLPALHKPGLRLALGANHNEWHQHFYTGLWAVLPDRAPLVGGVGQFDDYVYCDGRQLRDERDGGDGKPTPVGQLVITIQGDLKVAAATRMAVNLGDAGQIRRDVAEVAADLRRQVGPRPALVLGFSCVTRLRIGRLDCPTIDRRELATAFGADVPVFGAYCGGEVGPGSDDRLSVGGDRLVLAVISDATVSEDPP